MPPIRAIHLGLKLTAAGRHWTAHFIDTGVPHAVIETRGLERFPVSETGRVLRHHPTFGLKGANIDFVSLRASSAATRPAGSPRNGPDIRLRTYERGVEDETLACGTGAVAAAVCCHLLRQCKPPIRVLTHSGDILTVGFKATDRGFNDVWLEGPASITFKGEVYL